MKLNNFRGDLTDISAKKEALLIAYTESPRTFRPTPCYKQQKQQQVKILNNTKNRMYSVSAYNQAVARE